MSTAKEALASLNTAAPSIGTAEPSYHAVGARVRMIHQIPINNRDEIMPVLNLVRAISERHGATRSNVRAFMLTDLLTQPPLADNFGKFVVEAAIPLEGGFDGLTLVYLSYNDPSRKSHPEVMQREKDFIIGLSTKKIKPPLEIIKDAYIRGYTLERLHGQLSLDDLDDLASMYNHSFGGKYPFPITEMIPEMVTNPNTHLLVARRGDNGRLDSVCATEEMVLGVGGQRFVMREMGDSAKMPHSEKLNGPLKLALGTAAARDGIDLVFTETRAVGAPVNVINHNIGMTYRGILETHCPIGGTQDIVPETELNGPYSGQFANMNVYSWGKTDLMRIAQALEIPSRQ